MCTISTSRTSGARRIRASTSVSGSAHPGWMYTRMADRTQLSAWSGVCSFFAYSLSQDMIVFPTGFSFCCYLRDCPLSNCQLVTDGAIVDRPVKKLVQPLEHLHLAKDFDGAFDRDLLLDEVPEVLLGQDNRLNKASSWSSS